MKKPSIWYIIIPVFFLTFSTGALFAPMIEFYTIVFCERYYKSKQSNSVLGYALSQDKCAIPEVQSIVSKIQAIILFSYYITPLLVAGYYGSLSDRKGRRLVFKISALGNMVLMTCYVLTTRYRDTFGISLLFIGPVVRGLLAGDNVTAANIQAYISDCTTPSSRTVAYGHMIAITYLGASLGPSAASLLIKKTGSIEYLFYGSALISLVFECYIFFVLPESHNFKDFKERDAQRMGLLQSINVLSALQILNRKKSKHANKLALPLIAGSQFLLTICMLPPIILYAMLQFGWTSYEGGFFISLTSFTRWMAVAVLLPVMSKLYYRNKNISPINHDPDSRIDISPSPDMNNKCAVQQQERTYHSIVFDMGLIRFGLIAETVCLFLLGLVNDSFSFTAVGVLQSLSALALPSFRSMLTTLVDPSEVGELFGAVAIIESFGSKYNRYQL
ncbi:major facilitator superfamily domain-containing protein [Pilobolus umbonatus]|nr:major facilitator superfamily domain-containing protein [Pilobolus umbonatus]